MTNFSLVERVQGHGPEITRSELILLTEELDDWREVCADVGVCTPEDMTKYIQDTEALPLCRDDDHIDHEVYRQFFEDCIEWVGVNATWIEKREAAKILLDAIKEVMPL